MTEVSVKPAGPARYPPGRGAGLHGRRADMQATKSAERYADPAQTRVSRAAKGRLERGTEWAAGKRPYAGREHRRAGSACVQADSTGKAAGGGAGVRGEIPGGPEVPCAVRGRGPGRTGSPAGRRGRTHRPAHAPCLRATVTGAAAARKKRGGLCKPASQDYSILNLFLNLSTLPPVSTSFCFPVKNG